MIDQKKTSVFIVDDHDMVRAGLTYFLQSFDDLELIGETNNGNKALEMIQMLNPDVVLMDLVMPGISGIEIIKAVHQSCTATKILALTSFNDKQLIFDAMHAGAIGYILKNVSIDELANAIRSAAEGKPTVNADVLQVLIEFPLKEDKTDADDFQLTNREHEVLSLIVNGLTNQKIAETLMIETSTVKSHVSNILKKLDASSRTEAAALATQLHLIKEKPDGYPSPS
ncbi:MAG: DNA-binding response regulator [Anaerolineaceae bacterium]|nr:DNA-binding response regulator [Anaerolineaceae bacterium]